MGRRRRGTRGVADPIRNPSGTGTTGKQVRVVGMPGETRDVAGLVLRFAKHLERGFQRADVPELDHVVLGPTKKVHAVRVPGDLVNALLVSRVHKRRRRFGVGVRVPHHELAGLCAHQDGVTVPGAPTDPLNDTKLFAARCQ